MEKARVFYGSFVKQKLSMSAGSGRSVKTPEIEEHILRRVAESSS